MENLGLLGGVLPMLLNKQGNPFEGTGINPAIFGLGGLMLGNKNKQGNMFEGTGINPALFGLGGNAIAGKSKNNMMGAGIPSMGLLTQLLNR